MNPYAPYVIVREIARGGMGVVYEVEHSGTHGRYALKTLVEDMGEDELTRFRTEAESLARLDHPHVVRIHTARFDGPTPWLVQDLLSGGTLKDRLRSGPLPVAEAVRHAAKLAGGLHAAHALGILHRDLKPANVLYDDQGEPHLADFGLARTSAAQGLTQSGTIMGTPSYMAPEQAHDPRAVDQRADVYGLGAVFYAMLTGVAPFTGKLFETLDAVVNTPPTPPSHINPQVPPAVEALCLKALAKNPKDRPQTAQTLASDLEESLTSPRPRTRWPLALVVIALVSSVLVLVSLAAALRPATGIDAATYARRSELLIRDVRRLKTTGDSKDLHRLLNEARALLSEAQHGHSRELRQAASDLSLVEGAAALARGERGPAQAALERGWSGEGATLLARLLQATGPDAEPTDAVARLEQAAKRVRLPALRLLLARWRGRTDLSASPQRARALQRDVEALERDGLLSPETQLLRVRALVALDEPEDAFALVQSGAAVPPDLRLELALILLPARLDVATRNLQEAAKRFETAVRLEAAGASLEEEYAVILDRLERRVLNRLDADMDRADQLFVGVDGAGLGDARRAAGDMLLSRCQALVDSIGLPYKKPRPWDVELLQRTLRLLRRVEPDRRVSAEALDSFVKCCYIVTARRPQPTVALSYVLGELVDREGRAAVYRDLGLIATAAVKPSARRELIPLVREAIRLVGGPDRLRIRRNLVELLITQKDWTSADLAEAEAEALRLLSEPLETRLRGEVLYLRGRLHAERGDPEKALVEFDEALRLTPGERTFRHHRNLALRRAGRGQEALTDAWEFSKAYADGTGGSFFIEAISILWDFGREDRERLLPALRSLLDHYPTWWGWHLRATVVELEVGQDRAAADRLGAILPQAQREFPAFKDRLAAALDRLKGGETATALNELRAMVAYLDELRLEGDHRVP